MTKSDFLAFAGGAGANVVKQSEYEALGRLVADGFQSGVAQSGQVNKVMRQASIMAAVLAQFIADKSGDPSIDDGSTATLLANLSAAVRATMRDMEVLVDTGVKNTYMATNKAPLTALAPDVVQYVRVAHANDGPSTYAPDGLSAKPIVGLGLVELEGGELVAYGVACLQYTTAPAANDGNGAWVLFECIGAPIQVAPASQPHHAVQREQVAPVCSISALPTKNIGPIAVAECGEIWIWSDSVFFKGYRSPLCGRPLDGHTAAPLVSEVDAVGGTLSKTAYAALWGYAQENDLVVASGAWAPGMHRFVDLGGDSFQCPDLRNQFRRYTGTDADTANARTLGTYKSDTVRKHFHGPGYMVSPIQSTNATSSRINTSGTDFWTVPSQDVGYGSGETAPRHTAYAPRLHV